MRRDREAIVQACFGGFQGSFEGSSSSLGLVSLDKGKEADRSTVLGKQVHDLSLNFPVGSTGRRKGQQAFVLGQEGKGEASHLGSSAPLLFSHGFSPYLSASQGLSLTTSPSVLPRNSEC